jgi:pilus assembly protein TadC
MKKLLTFALTFAYLAAALTVFALADVSGVGMFMALGGAVLIAVLGIAFIIVALALIIRELLRRRRNKKWCSLSPAR